MQRKIEVAVTVKVERKIEVDVTVKAVKRSPRTGEETPRIALATAIESVQVSVQGAASAGHCASV
jgi:hypothetical protein